MCTDVFANCFELIQTLGDLWSDAMGCYPSSDSACFKPEFKPETDDGAGIDINIAIEPTSKSTQLTNNLTFTSVELTTVTTDDDNRLLITNTTMVDKQLTEVENTQDRLSSSGNVETTQNATTVSVISKTTKRNVVIDELEGEITATGEELEKIQRIATTGTISRTTTTTTLQSVASPKCEILTIESCSKYYNRTSLLNGDDTRIQAEKTLPLVQSLVSGIVSSYCAQYLESFICAGSLPPCDSDDVVLRYIP